MSNYSLTPSFGAPVSPWFLWFAWHPVMTVDRGWRWLCPIWRRRVQKHDHLTGGADFWFQNVAWLPLSEETTGEVDA